jgi:hypothetical protein
MIFAVNILATLDLIFEILLAGEKEDELVPIYSPYPAGP